MATPAQSDLVAQLRAKGLDEKTREGAIGIISALARPGTAASVAAAFPSPEAARALATLAASSGGKDRQELNFSGEVRRQRRDLIHRDSSPTY